MSFDLPSMLGEYLLPLLILVPLAIVVMLIAARQHKDDHWSHSRNDPLPPNYTKPRTITGTPTAAAPAAPASAPSQALAPAPVQRRGADFAVTQPAPEDDVAVATAPEPTAAVTPFLTPLDDALSAATPTRETEAPPPAPAAVFPRRRASDALPGPTAPQGGPVPVLIVDDSAVVRAKLSKLLSGAGFAVTMARHGHEALEELNQHWFALMITDLEMPEMDGFELIQHVSGDIRSENLPIVAITGHEELGARVADVKGLYGIFKKPWNDRELLARVGVLTQLRPRV
jgi:CheY-like chemotaxis protein